MNYEIIFYHSGKTSEIEKIISSKLSSVGMEMTQSIAATVPAELAEFLGSAFDRVDAVIIVGGLDGGKQSTDNVLSTVLSTNGSKMKSNKIVDDDGNNGYIIRCLEQTIIVLPDETSVIANMLEKKIVSEFSEIYKLKPKSEKVPSIESIARELDQQLSSISRVRTSITAEKDEKQKKSFKGIKIAIIVLIVFSLFQLLSAGYLYFINYMI